MLRLDKGESFHHLPEPHRESKGTARPNVSAKDQEDIERIALSKGQDDAQPEGIRGSTEETAPP